MVDACLMLKKRNAAKPQTNDMGMADASQPCHYQYQCHHQYQDPILALITGVMNS